MLRLARERAEGPARLHNFPPPEPPVIVPGNAVAFVALSEKDALRVVAKDSESIKKAG